MPRTGNASAIFVILLMIAFGCAAKPLGQAGPTLRDLTDEQSRADLFQLVTAAAEQNNPPSPGGIPFNLYGPFVFPSDATFDVVQGQPRTKSIFGIDISHYTPDGLPFQNLVAWHATYVYAKATQGTSFKDGKFSDFWSAMGQLTGASRVHRGAYHFLSSDPAQSSVDQAKTFLSFMKQNGGLQPTDMPPVLDLEWDIARKDGPDRWSGQDPDQIVDKVIQWLDYVQQQTNRPPMLYTADAWWRGIHAEKNFTRLSKYNIWIADYSRSSRGVEVPTVPQGAHALLWQFTETARLAAGFPGTLDANIYKNSEDQFYSDFKVRKFD